MTLILAVLASTCALHAQQAAAPQAASEAGGGRPNFIFILVDDLRHDVFSFAGHPFVRTPGIDRLAREGARFNNAFVTTALCSPSRASFLTGQYARVHGVTTNEGPELRPDARTFPVLLREAGYETAFIGKYHMGVKADPRPGFDYWLSFVGQGVYTDPVLNENGREVRKSGYITDILTDYAVRWLEQPHTRPFCLYLSHKAVHADFIPAERHKTLYADASLPEPASYRDDLSDKPEWMRMIRIRGGRLLKPAPASLPAAFASEPWKPRPSDNPKTMGYLRALAAVDDSTATVLDLLARSGLRERTIVVFAGDNGFFHGEHHGMGDKRLAYEESMRIPLLACGPGIPAGRKVDGMVLNIDLAPTLLDYAGVPAPGCMQGRSFRPLLTGDGRASWRDAFLYEYHREDWLPGMPDILAVRTSDAKYVTFPTLKDIDELYDLRKDPIEMHNLANDPGAEPRVAAMKQRLDQLVRQIGGSGFR